jgi:hypothetical protein
MIGQTVGNLLILQKSTIYNRRYIVKCNCGKSNEFEVGDKSLESQKVYRCHMCHTLTLPINNLIGKTYGLLNIIGYMGKINNLQYWKIKCNCSYKTEFINCTKNIVDERVTSCGCNKFERGQLRQQFLSEYSSYRSMKDRCTLKSHIFYDLYGGRGITICKEWADSKGFPSFIKDMGPKPSEEHTLDRINSDGNYESLNCVWATRKEQVQNRLSNKICSKSEADKIRNMYSTGNYTYEELAELYDCANKTIGNIISNKSWI